MAKTSSRRLDSRLLAVAESSGALFHRSGTEQLEHWATLGAAVESALGLPSVAKLKSLGRTPDIDALIAKAGTPAGNKKLARFLAAQPFPQYGATDTGRIIEYSGDPRKSSSRINYPESDE